MELLPQLTQWRLEESQAPIRATVSMELGTWLPFDETTLAALNLLLSHVSFQVETLHMAQEDWSRAAVLLDGVDTGGADPATGELRQTVECILCARCYAYGSF